MSKVTVIESGQRDDYYYRHTADATKFARMWRKMGARVFINNEPFEN